MPSVLSETWKARGLQGIRPEQCGGLQTGVRVASPHLNVVQTLKSAKQTIVTNCGESADQQNSMATPGPQLGAPKPPHQFSPTSECEGLITEKGKGKS